MRRDADKGDAVFARQANTKSDMRRAYSYKRFSSPKQSRGDSIRRQTAFEQEIVKEMDLLLDDTLDLSDTGVSAFHGKNSKFGTLSEFMNLVEVRQMVELGAAHVNIAEIAGREAADLVIMSTHGRTGLDHILLGSVTEKVIAHAPCPVLAIPVSKRPAVMAA